MIGTAEYVNVSPHEWGRPLAVGSPGAGPAWRVRSELARQRLQRIESAAVEVGFHPVHGHVIDEDLQIVSDFCGDSVQLPLLFPWRAICARIGQADYLVVHTPVDSPFCIITWSAGQEFVPLGAGEEIPSYDVAGLRFRGAKEMHRVPHVDRPRLDQRIVCPQRGKRATVTGAV